MQHMARKTILLPLLLAACAGRAERPKAPVPAPAEAPDPGTPSDADVRALLGAEPLPGDVAGGPISLDAGLDVALPWADPRDFDLPLQLNEEVLRWIDVYQGRYREQFATYLKRMGRYGPMIRAKLRERGMPEDLVYLAMIESGFSPRAYSRAHAVGIWQFIAGTARRYGLEVSRYVDERRDPVKATDAALDYLSDLYERFGSWYLAAAAYNTGGGRIERILRRHAGGRRGDDALYWQIRPHIPRETRAYVPKLLAAAVIGTYPEQFGFADVTPAPALAYDVVTVPDATELAVVARAAGVDEDVIEGLNPQFRRRITPPGRSVEVRIPAGRAERFAVAYAKIPPEERVRYFEHTIRRGDTLYEIARRYGTTVAVVRQANRIRNPRALVPGRRLVIPKALASAPRRRTEPVRTGARSRTARADGTVVHRVRRGETLWEIARRYDVTVDALAARNDMEAGEPIRPGQLLRVPTAATVVVHRVQPGDTLWDIARQHGVSARDLMEWNQLPEGAVLHPGDRLEVRLGR